MYCIQILDREKRNVCIHDVRIDGSEYVRFFNSAKISRSFVTYVQLLTIYIITTCSIFSSDPEIRLDIHADPS